MAPVFIINIYSPYACNAVSVEVLDQVHQFRGQAPSPKYCPQYPMVDQIKGLAEVHNIILVVVVFTAFIKLSEGFKGETNNK